MLRIEKLEEFEQAVHRADPDFGLHLGGAVAAIVAGVGVLALIVGAMTQGVTLVPPLM